MLAALKNILFYYIREWFRLFSTDCTETLPQGPILVIAPHPDDETIGCGATVARLCSEGRKVRVIIVSDGGASTQSAVVTSSELAAIRREEALNAARTLGLSEADVIFLSYPDSHITSHKKEVSETLLAQITQYMPSIIFMPHRFDEHADHRAVAHIIEQLRNEEKIHASILQYPIWYRTVSWPYGMLRCLLSLSMYRQYRYINIEDFLAKKRKALIQFHSQFENLTGEDSWQYFSEATRRRFCGSTELFLEVFADGKNTNRK